MIQIIKNTSFINDFKISFSTLISQYKKPAYLTELFRLLNQTAQNNKQYFHFIIRIIFI